MSGPKKYVIKSRKYYKELTKKSYYTVLNIFYQTAFRPYDVIGKCMYSFCEWYDKTTKHSLESFFNFYIQDIKSMECFETMAAILSHLCNSEGLNVTKNECLDILINHGIIETYYGGIKEKFVHEYIKTQKDTYLLPKNDEWDRKYNIDNGFIYNNKTFLIQIKPLSFFLGKEPKTIEDRKLAIIKTNNFKIDNKEYKDATFKYVVYEEREDGIYFLKDKKSIFIKIDEKYFDENVDYFRYDFCGDKSLWEKLIDF